MSAGHEGSTLNDNLEQFPVLDLKDGLCCISLSKESQETFALEGENLESGKEEKKPPDPSLSPRQPMKCLAGNGTAGTPGAAWADGLDAPAPPFLPSHWVRVQWWHCQPCSGMEPGKCTELSQGIEREQPREVKKEGRREVRQQASSTKLLCKQVPLSSEAAAKAGVECHFGLAPAVCAGEHQEHWGPYRSVLPQQCVQENIRNTGDHTGQSCPSSVCRRTSGTFGTIQVSLAPAVCAGEHQEHWGPYRDSELVQLWQEEQVGCEGLEHSARFLMPKGSAALGESGILTSAPVLVKLNCVKHLWS
ncbi:uncharacterized protein LOC127462162 isoform X3 [Manacus candei]|uniref:uncharacterized protein LOC127462162 isoform X3 n=1 Tax=Manacus candei TaxID=415023 RepID=UPI002226E6CA|nr:uncharacterized protein LOC127462162 isoform X3 [Manacus candei]XP_051626525.1 uncharacterized protein LOC127462162 isoform X3 [Manacus candei]XP_051626526.1 uncharacterized protein LOC127462162 isoform X3 [Manacus candei]XP_051626527.1 uncharacterized protein LOC127462162 isoform X3 [Manacus candei]XP_051626528.1 uncharacterized protein LOC127462162 isoform X3 [Manacus candei]XP_051626529.1 uncharacterized protein LOC127462162 isoform X3 [Manacus candei]XP_051626531.1 uncharacterized prot